MKRLPVTFLLVLWASGAYAAGFNCDKASTFVEKTICSDEQLSHADDALMQAFKNAMQNPSSAAKIKSEQITWLTKVRNQCKDKDCLTLAYKERLAALASPQAAGPAPQGKDAGQVVAGRCHMGSCWWWKIDGTEVVQSEAKGRLVKVATRTATVDLSSAELKKHGYPKMPPRTAQWEDASESYLLCSTKLPVYISYDEDKKRYMGTIPFDQQGETAGATEGVGNLYRAVCDGGKKVTFAIDPKTEAWDIPLDKPTDIFSH